MFLYMAKKIKQTLNKCVKNDRPVLDQNLYYVGMTYTSATFASATANVLPAITFVLAIIFRFTLFFLILVNKLIKHFKLRFVLTPSEN